MTRPPKAYLDTNVFIVAYEQKTARADHARWILDAVEAGRLLGATSELTLAELLVRPLRDAATDLVRAYEAMIRSVDGFEVAPIARTILVEAARVRAARNAVRLPDAIHLATAVQLGCACIITSDVRLGASARPVGIGVGPFTVDEVLALSP